MFIIAMEAPTIALAIMGAIALIVAILVLSSRRPGPTGTSVYDAAEKPDDQEEPPPSEASETEEEEAETDES